MPWQQLVADVGGELDPKTGLPAYRTVVVTVPRQSGKTTLFLAWEVQRATGWKALGPQRIVYSAQTGLAAKKKLIEDQVPVLEPRKKTLGITKILQGIGNEAVVFGNGSRLVLMGSSDDSGHGSTVDLGIVDELFADHDQRRFQALRPAMNTREYGQILVSSTMGTDESVPLNQLVARGRAAVEAGQRSGIAYFEWSADPAEDPDDPETWYGCMPALGFTQTEGVVAGERASGMPDGEFRRAFLNQQTKSDDRVIPAADWDAVCDLNVVPGDGLSFGLDVNPERSAGSIVACSGGSTPVAELTFNKSGTDWIVPTAAALSAKWARPEFLVDVTGPAAALVPELEQVDVRVRKVPAREMVDACGAFYDRVMSGRIRLRRNLAFDAAAAGASKRVSGDAWAWARKHTSVDVTPLVAVTLAAWAAAGPSADSVYEDRELVVL